MGKDTTREDIDDLQEADRAHERDISDIKDSIEKIETNHLAHMQESLIEMARSHAVLETNVGWLLKYHWITATAAVGAVITGLVSLLSK